MLLNVRLFLYQVIENQEVLCQEKGSRPPRPHPSRAFRLILVKSFHKPIWVCYQQAESITTDYINISVILQTIITWVYSTHSSESSRADLVGGMIFDMPSAIPSSVTYTIQLNQRTSIPLKTLIMMVRIYNNKNFLLSCLNFEMR